MGQTRLSPDQLKPIGDSQISDLSDVKEFQVLSRSLSDPPGSPAAGNAYVVGPSPTGAWSGRESHIAHYLNSSWQYNVPATGLRVWVADEDTEIRFNGISWDYSATHKIAGTTVATTSPTDDARLTFDQGQGKYTPKVSMRRLRMDIQTISAGASIAINTVGSLVKIANDSASAANVISSLPSGVEGEALVIYNADPSPVTGLVNIPSGKVVMLIYIDGAWRKVGIDTTLQT